MKKVIISPHPDDELIGCFTLLEKKVIDEVWYFSLDEKKRIEEAKNLAKYYKFKPIFIEDIKKIKHLNFNDYIFFIPGDMEYQPFHRKVLKLFKKLTNNINEYSVEKNVFTLIELSKEEKEKKEKLLNKYYKSQKDLWKYNKKYIYFEQIEEKIKW